MALVYTDREIIRSVFHAIRKYVVQLGYYPDVSTFADTPAGLAAFQTALNNIKASKGFYVEVFSESSARNKGKKDAPRIVVVLGRSFPGSIGSNPNAVLPGAIPGTFKRVSEPSLSTHIMVEVYLVSGTSEQHYLLNAIKDNVLGERTFIEPYTSSVENPQIPFLAFQSGYYELDEPMESTIERAYIYTVPDVYRGDVKEHRTNIPAIKEIDLDINPTNDNIHISNNL